MASSTAQKQPCATCGKPISIFICHGCRKDFCTRHAAEHRQALGKQMDEATLQYDQLQQSLNDQTTEPSRHRLMKEIDEWERQSIEKIHQAADDARKQFSDVINKHTSNIKKALEDLAKTMSKSRDDDDFVEADLKQWTDKLEKLKKDLTTPPAISSRHDNSEKAFISKIIISNDVSVDCFEQSAGDIRIEENGQVIIHGQSTGHAAVRGRIKYSFGRHQFCFKIEQLDNNKWVFFGIKSGNASMVADSANTRTAYGWTGFNHVCLDGVATSNYNAYKTDFELNDLIELFVDCDNHIMRLTNRRTQNTYELNVDVTKCPLPWQLNLGLHYSSYRVRMIGNTSYT